MLVWAVAPAALLVAAGCNAPLVFTLHHPPPDAGADKQTVGNGDAPMDLPGPDNIGAIDTGPDVRVDAPPDLPIDMGTDMAFDTPRDLPPVDVSRDLPRDVVNDLPRDLPRDTSGPIVCAQSSQCGLSSLRCLVAGGQPGTCVECLTDSDCAPQHCDLNLHRCVECLVGTDCPLVAGDDSHPSTCSVGGHCLNGCDDSSTPPPVCPKQGFTCTSTGAVDNLCVQCMADGDCTTGTQRVCANNNLCSECKTNTDCPPTKPMCDSVSNLCVQCLTSTNCNRFPTTPLCSPKSLICVALP